MDQFDAIKKLALWLTLPPVTRLPNASVKVSYTALIVIAPGAPEFASTQRLLLVSAVVLEISAAVQALLATSLVVSTVKIAACKRAQLNSNAKLNKCMKPALVLKQFIDFISDSWAKKVPVPSLRSNWRLVG